MRCFGLICIPHDSGRLVGYPSGQRGQTVNLLAYAFDGSNPSPTTSLRSERNGERRLSRQNEVKADQNARSLSQALRATARQASLPRRGAQRRAKAVAPKRSEGGPKREVTVVGAPRYGSAGQPCTAERSEKRRRSRRNEVKAERKATLLSQSLRASAGQAGLPVLVPRARFLC